MNQQSGYYKKIKTTHLDNLELLKATSYNEDFPLHSHETFCISLIENGTFKENQQYAPTGTIFITNPNEMHTNDLVHETGSSKLYISAPMFLHI
jgi:AraC-like ligand binding domain